MPIDEAEILRDRAQRAAKIVAQADQYKICEGCESIVTTATITCPNCHGYRFDSAPERVIAQANLLATRLPTSLQAQDYA